MTTKPLTSVMLKEAPIAFLILLLLAMALARVGFYNPSNIYSLCYAVSLSVPVAIGIQLLLVTGYFDLSVGAVAALSSVVAALVANKTDSVLLAFAIALVIGGIAGLINGFVVTRLKVHCLIATIATLGLLRTLALTANDGMVIAGLPSRFMWLARHQTLGVEFPMILGAVLVVGFSFLSLNAVLFRRFYQMGSNPISAEICGLRTSRIVMTAFVFCAIGASITGLLGASRTMAASPTGTESLALDTIAACVIGGSDLRGGTGSIWGALIGLVIVQIASTAVILFGVSLYWRYGVIGVILIAAIVLNRGFKKSIDAGEQQ